MRQVVTGLIITIVVFTTRFSSASDSAVPQQTITVQVHDYARVPAASLSSAAAIVTRMYEQIGVRINWKGVVRWEGRRARYESSEAYDVAQITLIILNPKMAMRGQVAPDVLGYAAVPDEGM